jgi:hypothetical protein
MIDTRTQKPIRVTINRMAAPHISLPLSQLDEIRALLDRHGVDYWPDSIAVSIDGKPLVVVVNLGRKVDVDFVQSILDEVS